MMKLKSPITLLSSVLLFSCSIAPLQAQQQPTIAAPSSSSHPIRYNPPSKAIVAKRILQDAQKDWRFSKTGRVSKIEPTNLQQTQGVFWISASIPTWKITLDSDDQRLVFISNAHGTIHLLASRTNPKLSKQVPKSVIQAVQRSIANSLNPNYKNDPTALHPYQVLIKSASRQQWPDGCLGLPKPGEPCTFATVSGWRIVAEGKTAQSLAFRVDATGRQVRAEVP